MKGFVIAICVVVIIFGLVIANSLYTLNVTNILIDKISSLNSDNYILMNEIQEIWDNNRFFLCLSSSTKETDKIEDMLSVIKTMYKTGEFLGLEEKKSLLINYIRLINNHEKLSVENIL